MQCNEIRNYFADYIKEGLQGAAQAEFSQHLRECPSCNAELEGLTDIWVKVGSVPTGEPASPDMEVRFRAAVEESKQQLNSQRHARVAWWQRTPIRAATAAAVLAVVLVPFIRSLVFPETVYSIVEAADGSLYRVVDGKSQTVKVGERIAAGKILRTEEGAGAVLALPDGSRIEMHAKSELSLEHAEDGTRIHLNVGSVLITPAKQSTGNLYVQNRETTVHVTGAMFQSATAAVATAVQIPARLEFEVASVRPIDSDNTRLPTRVRCRGVDGELSPIPAGSVPVPQGRCVADNVPLRSLVAVAYDVFEPRISGLPNYPSDRAIDPYQIDARAEDPSRATKEELRQMLQNLLTDRFRLKLHREIKEADGYVLHGGKDEVKFRETSGDEEMPTTRRLAPALDSPASPRSSTPIAIKGKFRLRAFTDFLSLLTNGLPILDKTDLAGIYDINLSLNQNLNAVRAVSAAGVVSFSSGRIEYDPPLSKALEDQLGLRLESRKVPVEYLVVDHVEKPSEN